jgi:hypothetical protein
MDRISGTPKIVDDFSGWLTDASEVGQAFLAKGESSELLFFWDISMSILGAITEGSLPSSIFRDLSLFEFERRRSQATPRRNPRRRGDMLNA